MHLLIDADPIVYRCGFAAERAEYHLVVDTQREDKDEIIEVHFAPGDKSNAGDRMKKYLAEHPSFVVLDKERVAHAEPESHALEAVRTQINSIYKEIKEKYVSPHESTIALSGPGNFREQIATIVPYKGNRDPDHKPYHYQAIRDFLTGTYAARVVHGREADDEISILARRLATGLDPNDDYIIATIDKDLDQIPGTHYNYMKQVFHDVEWEDAQLFFYQQALSGDATDGVPGCWKVGEVKAQKIVYAALDKWNDRPHKQWDIECDKTIWTAIVKEYSASQARAGCPYAKLDPSAVALETAILVKLQEYPGQVWSPP